MVFSKKFNREMDCNNSSIKNLYNIGFECPVDRGSITVYLTCKNNKCSISEGLYFIVKFEKQIIDDIEYDTRLMFPSTNSDKTLDNFVDRNKIIYNEENYSISFNTGSENIVLNKAKTVNDLKCYVPLSEVIMNKGDCTSNDRCEQIIKEPRPVHIINVSTFTGLNKAEENGGAIHLIDCCLTSHDTTFKNCEANKGGGGAIYIENNLDYTNNITLEKLIFTECKAQYGGAVYIYSVSDRVPITITKCKFDSNKLIDSQSTLKGGSAIYLRSQIGSIKMCKFINNMNADSSVKIENDFDENKASRILSINKQNDDAVVNENSILISECDFEINKDSKSSIYFILGNSVTNIEVTQYNFMGMIANDAHHIDEKIIGKSSPKLSIN